MFVSGSHCGLHHFCPVSGFYFIISGGFEAYTPAFSDFLHLGWVNVFKLYQNTQETLVQERQCVLANAGRYSVIGFCNTAGNSGNGIAVTAKGDGVPNGILKGGGLKECLQCLGDTSLAGDIKSVFRTDVSQCEIHRIIVCIDIIPDLHHVATVSGHIDCNGSSFGALQPLGVIMGNSGYQMGQLLGCINAISSITASAYTHGSTITETVVRLRIIVIHPMTEMTTITAAGIRTTNFLHTDYCLLGQIAVVGFASHQCFTDGQRHDRVIREGTLMCQEVKLFGFDIVPLKSRAGNIADDCTNHMVSSLSLWW